MSKPVSTKQVIARIDEAPSSHKEYARKEEQQCVHFVNSVGNRVSGWGSGSASSAARYLCDHLRHEDTSEVDWHEVAAHFDNILPLEG